MTDRYKIIEAYEKAKTIKELEETREKYRSESSKLESWHNKQVKKSFNLCLTKLENEKED